MAYQKGRDHLIKLGVAGAGGTLAAVKNLTNALTNEAVDVSNKDSAGWRELGEDFGTQSIDITCDGVATDAATYETLKGYAQANSINTFYILGPDGDSVQASFQVTSFQEQSGHNNDLTFSLTLQSSGAVTFSNA